MLETGRLILKPMTSADVSHLFELNSDPEVVRYTGDSLSQNLADAQRILNELVFPQFQKYQMGRMSVFLKDGNYLGWCGLKFDPISTEVDLGYRFLKKFWGNGFATEASQASLKYGFEHLKLKKILARSMPENKASLKVIHKLGMTFRGLNLDANYPQGFLLYDLTDKEYQLCKK